MRDSRFPPDEDGEYDPDRIAEIMTHEKMALMNKCLFEFMTFWKDKPKAMEKGINEWLDINTWLTGFCQWQYHMLRNQTSHDAKLKILENIALQLGTIEEEFLKITQKEIDGYGGQIDISKWKRGPDGPSEN